MLTNSIDIELIRNELPCVSKTVYLNTATAGPLPKKVIETMERQIQNEFINGRASVPELFQFMKETTGCLRALVARLLNTSSEEIAITRQTTEGINIVLWGLDWDSRDEIITTNLEHKGGFIPLYNLHMRKGVKVKFLDLGYGDEPISKLQNLINRKTRLLMISHVAWSSGAILPLKEIIRVCHESNVLVLVDGAQAAGAIKVDLKQLDPDFYSIPGQKWLLGPEGTGALFVAKRCLSSVEPTFVGSFSVNNLYDYDHHTPHYLPALGAKRYEIGTLYRPGIIGFKESLGWLLDEVGLNSATTRSHDLAKYCSELLSKIDNVKQVTPYDQMGPIVTFKIEGVSAEALEDFLKTKGITIRYIPALGNAIRICTAFFNTPAEIEALGNEIDSFVNKRKGIK